MTAQIHDVLWRDDRSWVIGRGGAPVRLTSPPPMRCTACYRGWFADYRISDGRLFLETLWTYGACDATIAGQPIAGPLRESPDGPACLGRQCHLPLTVSGRWTLGQGLNGRRQCHHVAIDHILHVADGIVVDIRPARWWERLW